MSAPQLLITIAVGLACIAGLAPPAVQEEEPSEPETIWTLELKSDSKGSAAVGDIDGDGKPEIVFGTYFNDEHLYAVNAEDGTVLWKHKSDRGPFDASVAIVDLDGDDKPETLAADSATGTLFCLDGKGRLLWKLRLPSGTDSPPAVADLDGDGVKEIIVGTMWQPGKKPLSGHVSVIRSDNRKFVWQARIPGCVQSEPVIANVDGDRTLDVIVTSWRGDKSVHALSGKDGTTIWKLETAGTEKAPGMYHGVSAFAVRDTLRVAVAACSGWVYLLGSKGEIRWKKELDGEYLFAPTSVADLDKDGVCEIIVPGRKLHVLRAREGDEFWTHEFEGNRESIHRGAAVSDVDGDGTPDVVVAVGRTMYALDGRTGKEIWRFDAATKKNHIYEKISSAPVLGDFDGDGCLDVFFVIGKGTSGDQKPYKKESNYGVARVIRAGKGKGPGWPTFRGNVRRTGSAPRGGGK